MKTWQVIIISLLSGLLMAGVILLIALPPRGQAIQLAPLPTTAPLTIYITGEVNQPGVYSLPPGSRVKDAVQIANGLLPDADSAALNLAAPTQDGEHLVIPLIGDTPSSTEGLTPSSTTTIVPTSAYTAQNPLNINLAKQADFELLPGIGPTRAAAIIAYRDSHGPFTKTSDIQNVPGIGTVTFNRLKDIISVN
jgi:competence protein ComEA